MKNILGLLAIAIVACTLGCEAQKVSDSGDATTTDAVAKVSLEKDLCGACGCCAKCDDCCKGEKCDCGMQKGSALCCSGVKPVEGVVYCKDCGHDTKSESCCADSNTACSKCGLADDSPIHCKLKCCGDEGCDHEGCDHEGHNHEGDDHDHEGDDHDHEGDDHDHEGDDHDHDGDDHK